MTPKIEGRSWSWDVGSANAEYGIIHIMYIIYHIYYVYIYIFDIDNKENSDQNGDHQLWT